MVELVKMVRPADTCPPPHSADVHPDEVANYAKGGWRVVDGPDQSGGAEIPDDWEAMHWKQRVKLASDLSGRDDLSVDEANEIIAAAHGAKKAEA